MVDETSVFNRTPQSERIHIALFGRRNVGKSTLMNKLTRQPISLVSAVAGTTTDPIAKPIEIWPIGACLIIDTAGWDDDGDLGELRVQRTKDVIHQTDIALIVTDGKKLNDDVEHIKTIRRTGLPYLVVFNIGLSDEHSADNKHIAKELGSEVVVVDALNGQGIDELISVITNIVPHRAPHSLTGKLATDGDTIVLVMPQDPQAPRGRLILPQVQTIRDLLDKQCITICCTPSKLTHVLAMLSSPPKLIITDSQVFGQVYAQRPADTALTSFSVLMAAAKGNINHLIAGAQAIDRLTTSSRVLIAEACTHAPLPEDIGREQIPRLLRKRVGDSLQIDVVTGRDFPQDLSSYHLVIHCGACMFNRQMMMSRINMAQQQGIPITNYGIAIAHMQGILDKVAIP